MRIPETGAQATFGFRREDRRDGGRLPEAHLARVEASRSEILQAVGDTADLTFVRGAGNLGDELIWAGVRRLLAGRPYREVGLEDLARCGGGHTAVLTGGGAWCRPYHELMPAALGLAEQLFDRVVVLPSSFDPSVDAVRRALEKTRAVVFARERESLLLIRGLCDARLAHDAAFFCDLSPWRLPGSGLLEAWRTDPESSRAFPLPPGNADISSRCSSLDEWLWIIARHAVVRTDRAHVMIAAALLGKRVEVRPSSYHKVPAIAEYALADFDVRLERRAPRLAALGPPVEVAPPPEPQELPGTPELSELRGRMTGVARANLSLLPPGLLQSGGEPRVTVVLLSWDKLDLTLNAMTSLSRSVQMPYRLLVIDNGSAPEVREELLRVCAALDRTELVLLDQNQGCAGARQLAVDRVSTEYVLFLDNDAELFPGSVEHLVHCLDAHPEALAAGAQLVLPDGRLQLCGGRFREEHGVLHCDPQGAGLRFGDPALGSSGPCDWLAGAAMAVRRSALCRHPFDLGMAHYYEDTEWCYRVRGAAPAPFRRCVEALALHHQELKAPTGTGLAARARSMPFLESIARFHRAHGVALEGVFLFAPELVTPAGRDVHAARLLLELTDARGGDWVLLQWLAGGLAPLWDSGIANDRQLLLQHLERSRQDAAAALSELRAIHGSKLWRAAHVYWSLRNALRAGWSLLTERET